MAPNHKVTVLYSFAGPPDAANPSGPLLLDKSGNPYGTSVWGGTSNQGTVFKLTSAGDETVLYSFAGYPSDGSNPEAGVIHDPNGSLYGTTAQGGSPSNMGTVFKLDITNKETILHSFTTPRQGMLPEAGLRLDKAGNLYGTTYYGGPRNSNDGTIFKLIP